MINNLGHDYGNREINWRVCNVCGGAGYTVAHAKGTGEMVRGLWTGKWEEKPCTFPYCEHGLVRR